MIFEHARNNTFTDTTIHTHEHTCTMFTRACAERTRELETGPQIACKPASSCLRRYHALLEFYVGVWAEPTRELETGPQIASRPASSCLRRYHVLLELYVGVSPWMLCLSMCTCSRGKIVWF